MSSNKGTVVFDNNMRDDPNKLVLLVKASKDELANVRRYYLTYNDDKSISERRTGKANIIEAPPGTNDPKLYTLIITIPFEPVRYGGNTRKKNTRKNNTRKNKNT